MAEAISDEAVSATLRRFAAAAAVVLEDPAAWLGDGDEPDGDQNPLERVAGAARGLLTGDRHPGTAQWSGLPVEDRVDWWVNRIRAVAAPIAATPRFFGVAADRLPVQAAFGTAVAGLAVCAVAREHGVTAPEAWVPLLGRVLLERDLARPTDVGPAPQDDGSEPPVRDLGPVRRAAGGLWRLTRILWALNGIFDDRPRGAWAWRALGKLPVVGLAGGVLDERGAVKRAARETAELVAAGAR